MNQNNNCCNSNGCDDEKGHWVCTPVCEPEPCETALTPEIVKAFKNKSLDIDFTDIISMNSVLNDMFRKKIEHMKEELENELETL